MITEEDFFTLSGYIMIKHENIINELDYIIELYSSKKKTKKTSLWLRLKLYDMIIKMEELGLSKENIIDELSKKLYSYSKEKETSFIIKKVISEL
jgi:hypothetical protein